MYLTDDPEHKKLWKEFVRLGNEAHAKTMAGPNYIPLRKGWLEEIMTTSEDFWKAWKNYTFKPEDPTERLKTVVKDRLDIDIMYTQAYDILKWGMPTKTFDEIKVEVAGLIDDELLSIFTDFVSKHKGD